jgi:hypothetical protein
MVWLTAAAAAQELLATQTNISSNTLLMQHPQVATTLRIFTQCQTHMAHWPQFATLVVSKRVNV